MSDFLPANSIGHLKILLAYAHVCEFLDIDFNGSKLEEKVTNAGQKRSGKFIKHLKGRTEPNHETICELAKLAPNVSRLFHCPVWPVLSLIEGNDGDILNCFEKLDLDVQICALQKQRDEIGRLLIKEIRTKDIWQLHRIGSLHALACLILLRFLREEETYYVSKQSLSGHILDVIINLRVVGVLPFNFGILIHVLSKAFAWNTEPLMQARIDEKIIDDQVTQKEALLLNLRKLHPFEPDNYSLKVLGLFDNGYSDLILQETKYACEANSLLIQLSPPTGRGLYWLLKKLNQHREPRDRYVYKTDENNFYFYKPLMLVQ